MSIVNLICSKPLDKLNKKISTGLYNFFSNFGFNDAYFFYKNQIVLVSKLGINFLDDPTNWDYFSKPYYICFYLVYDNSISKYHFFYNTEYYPSTELIHLPLNFYSNQLVYTDNSATTRTATNGFARIFSIGDQIISPVYEGIQPNSYANAIPATIFDWNNKAVIVTKNGPNGIPIFNSSTNQYGVVLDSKSGSKGHVFNQLIIYPLGFVDKVIVNSYQGNAATSGANYYSSNFEISIRGNYQYFMIEIPAAYSLLQNDFYFSFTISPNATKLDCAFLSLKPIMGNRKVFGQGILELTKGFGYYIEKPLLTGRLEITATTGTLPPIPDPLDPFDIPKPVPPVAPPVGPKRRYAVGDVPIAVVFGDSFLLDYSDELTIDSSAAYNFTRVYTLDANEFLMAYNEDDFSTLKPKIFTGAYNNVLNLKKLSAQEPTRIKDGMLYQFAKRWNEETLDELLILQYADDSLTIENIDDSKIAGQSLWYKPGLGSDQTIGFQGFYFALKTCIESLAKQNKKAVNIGIWTCLNKSYSLLQNAYSYLLDDFICNLTEVFNYNVSTGRTPSVPIIHLSNQIFYYSDANAIQANQDKFQASLIALTKLRPGAYSTYYGAQAFPGFLANSPPTYGGYLTSNGTQISKAAHKNIADAIFNYYVINGKFGGYYYKVYGIYSRPIKKAAVTIFISDYQGLYSGSNTSTTFPLKNVYTMPNSVAYSKINKPYTDPVSNTLLDTSNWNWENFQPGYKNLLTNSLQYTSPVTALSTPLNIATKYAIDYQKKKDLDPTLPDMYIFNYVCEYAFFSKTVQKYVTNFDYLSPYNAAGQGLKNIYILLVNYIKKINEAGFTPYLYNIYVDFAGSICQTNATFINSTLLIQNFLVDFENFSRFFYQKFTINNTIWSFPKLPQFPSDQPQPLSYPKTLSLITNLSPYYNVITYDAADAWSVRFTGDSKKSPGTNAVAEIVSNLFNTASYLSGGIKLKIKEAYDTSSAITYDEADLIFFLGDKFHSGYIDLTKEHTFSGYDEVHTFDPFNAAFQNDTLLVTSQEYSSVRNKFNLAAIQNVNKNYYVESENAVSLETEIARQWKTACTKLQIKNKRLFIIPIHDYWGSDTSASVFINGAYTVDPYYLKMIPGWVEFEQQNVGPQFKFIENLKYALTKLAGFFQARFKTVRVLDIIYSDWFSYSAPYVIEKLINSGSYDIDNWYISNLRRIYNLFCTNFVVKSVPFTIYIKDELVAPKYPQFTLPDGLNQKAAFDFMNALKYNSLSSVFRITTSTYLRNKYGVNNHSSLYYLDYNTAKSWASEIINEFILNQDIYGVVIASTPTAAPVTIVASTFDFMQIEESPIITTSLPVTMGKANTSNITINYFEDSLFRHYQGRLSYAPIDNTYQFNTVVVDQKWQLNDMPILVCFGGSSVFGTNETLNETFSFNFVKSWVASDFSATIPNNLTIEPFTTATNRTCLNPIIGGNPNRTGVGKITFAYEFAKQWENQARNSTTFTPNLHVLMINSNDESWKNLSAGSEDPLQKNGLIWNQFFNKIVPKILDDAVNNKQLNPIIIGTWIDVANNVNCRTKYDIFDHYDSWLNDFTTALKVIFKNGKLPIWLPRTRYNTQLILNDEFKYLNYIYYCALAEQKYATFIIDVKDSPNWNKNTSNGYATANDFGIFTDTVKRDNLNKKTLEYASSLLFTAKVFGERYVPVLGLDYTVFSGGQIVAASTLPGANITRIALYSLFDIFNYNSNKNMPNRIVSWSDTGYLQEYKKADLEAKNSITLYENYYVEYYAPDNDFNYRFLLPAESLHVVGYASCPYSIARDPTPLSNKIENRVTNIYEYTPAFMSKNICLYYLFNFGKLYNLANQPSEEPIKDIANVNTINTYAANLIKKVKPEISSFKYEHLMEDEPFQVIYKMFNEGFNYWQYYQLKHIDFTQIELPFIIDVKQKVNFNGMENCYVLNSKDKFDSRRFKFTTTIMPNYQYGCLYICGTNGEQIEFELYSSAFKDFRSVALPTFIHNEHTDSYCRYLPISNIDDFQIILHATNKQSEQSLDTFLKSSKLFILLTN